MTTAICREEPEICQMITISTAHIKFDTIQRVVFIHRLTVLGNGLYGWFIYVPDDRSLYEDLGYPEELVSVMDYARERQCTWLCLDQDGPIVEGLEIFDW